MGQPPKVATLQDNINKSRTGDDFYKYSYWLSGPNSKHSALEQYDLLRTGYTRIIILRMPQFMEALLPEETKKFKHMLEFGNVGIDGIQGYSVETTQATGGFAGASIELPTGTKDDTNSITIKVYDTQGSLIRTYIDTWITGTFDPITGLNHYHGARDASITGDGGVAKTMYFSQANHTMEALIIASDPTGDIPEYVALTTNMFPKQSDHSHFNFDPGSHELVQISLEFTANKYMSSQINYLGKVALQQFRILKNFMLLYSGYSENNIKELKSGANITEWGGPFSGEGGKGYIVQGSNYEPYNYPSSNVDRRVDGISIKDRDSKKFDN